MTIRKHYFALVLILSLLGMALSVYSVMEYVWFQAGGDLSGGLCDINETFNCRGAIESSYSQLFGWPLGSYGFSFYLLLFGLSIFALKSFSEIGREKTLSFIFGVSALSLLGSLFLFYVSITQIGTVCPVCLSMYVVSIALFFVTCWAASGVRLGTLAAQSASVCCDIPGRLLLRGDSNSRRTTTRVSLVVLIAVAAGYALPSLAKLEQSKFGSDEGKKLMTLNQIYRDYLAAPERSMPPLVETGLNMDYRFGSKNPQVEIVEFFDYECPACRRIYPYVHELYEKYPDKVSVTYRNYPLDNRCNPSIQHSFHRAACLAAEIARCAGEQGAFGPALNDLMYLDEFEKDDATAISLRNAVLALPERLNLDKEGIEQCLDSERQRERIHYDIEQADQLGLQGTPLIFLNGKALASVHPVALRYVVRKLLGEDPSLESLETPLS
ncbi:MAG: thioredoxin domain-containing protein [Bdellovibrionales bacterium]|nr:thioredoxin domain-containing protein [Bdellovibrionales bacterium]